jgi:hypothetical protein
MAVMETHDILALVFAFLVVGGIFVRRLRAARRFSEENDQEAGVTTLFNGEK